MSEKDKSKEYELVLEGVDEENPQNLQKIKGILVGDMELSIEQAQNILTSFPLTIKRSPSELDLAVHFKALKAAGAQVMLLKPHDHVEEKEETSDEEEHSIEFEIDLDAHDLKPKKEVRPAGTFELNLDESTSSLADIEKEINESLQINASESEETAIESVIKEAPKDDFSLELMPADPGMELLDSPALSNMPPDTGEFEAERLSESLVSQAQDAVEHSQAAAPDMAKIEQSLLELASDGDSDTPLAPTTETVAAKPNNPASPYVEASNTEIALELDIDEEEERAKAEAEAKAMAALPPLPPKSNLTTESEEKQTAKSSAPAVAKEQANTESSAPAQTAAVAAGESKIKPAKQSASAGSESTLGKDTITAIVIGAVLLGVVNWFYFSGEQNNDVPAIQIPKEAEMANSSSNKKQEPKPVPEAPTYNYIAEYESDFIKINITLNGNDQQIKSAKVELSTSKPEPLTPEEIVQGKAPRLWLRKSESDTFKFTKNADGTFTGIASSKLYLEQGSDRNRIIGSTKLNVKLLDQDNIETGLIVELNPEGSTPSDSIQRVEKTPEGIMRVMISKVINLVKLAPLNN